MIYFVIIIVIIIIIELFYLFSYMIILESEICFIVFNWKKRKKTYYIPFWLYNYIIYEIIVKNYIDKFLYILIIYLILYY